MRKSKVGKNEAMHAVRVLMQWIGVDILDPGVVGTPDRVARALREVTAGYDVDIADLLNTAVFDSNADEMIVLKDVEFWSTCEHHIIPIHGKAAIGYIPDGGLVVGLSKLARLVHAHARRLQIQERMTADIAQDLMKHLKPLGTAVVIEATHLCMASRGVNTPGKMVTSHLTGVFRDEGNGARAEFLSLVRSG